MKIEICAVGGYSEVGRNMTAVKAEDEVVILDMGVNVAKIIDYEEEQESFDTKDMQRIDAIPDDSVIEDWIPKVKAICLTHAHLDHIAAIPFLAEKYKCPIYGTPYTIEVLEATLRDKNKKIPNELIRVKPNSTVKLSKNLKVEFIAITHSIPQTAMLAVHTPEGPILYTNDYKLDNHPTLGKAPNYQKLKSLAPILCLITDSLYAKREGHTPSESVARDLLKEVMLDPVNKDHALIVTSFASQIARIKSTIEFGQKTKRQIILLGRSMYKYSKAAENTGIVKFSDKAEIIGYSSKIKKKLKLIQRNREKYLIICTGNQGEKNAVLTKMAKGYFNFKPSDHIIFSCSTVPTEANIKQRERLEKALKKQKARLSLDIHSSGHCSRQDTEDLIKMTKPKLVIPAHGPPEHVGPIATLTKKLGFKAKLLENGNKIQVP